MWTLSNTTARQRRSKFTVERAQAFAERVLASYGDRLERFYGQKVTVEIVNEMPAGSRGKDALGMVPGLGSCRMLLSKAHVVGSSMASVKDTILHELAHLLCPFLRHDLDWREIAFELGIRDVADSDGHPMGYGLDVCWRKAKRLGVKPRPAYRYEVWIENQAKLRAAGYKRRKLFPEYALAGLSRDEAITKLADQIHRALCKRDYALVGVSGHVYARSKDYQHLNHDEIVLVVHATSYRQKLEEDVQAYQRYGRYSAEDALMRIEQKRRRGGLE